jgi:hypothetical protein
MYVTIQSATGKVLAHGYTTFSFKALSGITYAVCVSNYRTTVFSHWADGNANSCQTVTPSANLVLTAYFR